MYTLHPVPWCTLSDLSLRFYTRVSVGVGGRTVLGLGDWLTSTTSSDRRSVLPILRFGGSHRSISLVPPLTPSARGEPQLRLRIAQTSV